MVYCRGDEVLTVLFSPLCFGVFENESTLGSRCHAYSHYYFLPSFLTVKLICLIRNISELLLPKRLEPFSEHSLRLTT